MKKLNDGKFSQFYYDLCSNLKGVHTVIVHPGRTHMDDYMSLCVALILIPVTVDSPVRVLRKEPTLDELTDKNVLVLDVGGRYEPALRNFDHHQLPRDHAPECAFSLLLKHLELYDMFKDAFSWVSLLVEVDSKGIFQTANNRSVNPDAFAAISWNPIASFALKRLESKEVLDTEDIVWMTGLGGSLIDTAWLLRERLEWLKHTTAVLNWSGLEGLWVNKQREELEDPILGVNKFKQDSFDETVFSISPATRGDGWTIYRYPGCEGKIDFSKVADDPEVAFVHASGFLLTTKTACSEEKLQDLVRRSVL